MVFALSRAEGHEKAGVGEDVIQGSDSGHSRMISSDMRRRG